MRVDGGRKGLKCSRDEEERTFAVVGKGEKSLLRDPASELRPGREKERKKEVHGDGWDAVAMGK